MNLRSGCLPRVYASRWLGDALARMMIFLGRDRNLFRMFC